MQAGGPRRRQPARLANGKPLSPPGHMATNLDLEKLILSVLCLGTRQGPVKETLTPLLRDYQWQAPVHQVIFNALAAIPSNDPGVLRQLLPARLTRMGFPDIEWEEFFAPRSLSSEEALDLARRMLAGA